MVIEVWKQKWSVAADCSMSWCTGCSWSWMKVEFPASFAEGGKAAKMGIDWPTSGPDNLENKKWLQARKGGVLFDVFGYWLRYEFPTSESRVVIRRGEKRFH